MTSNSKQKVVAIVQARMGSTRLPGKILLTVSQKPLLEYLVERLRYSKEIDQIVIATTTNPKDDVIEDWCAIKGVACFRGSEEDVLDRYLKTAKAYKADVILRICSDCPLIDPAIVDQMIMFYRNNRAIYDYVSNTLERSYPRGLDAEVFTFSCLEEAAKNAKFPEEREHATLYIYRHPERFRLGNFVSQRDLSYLRWTVDEEADFKLISLIIQELYPKKHNFNMNDILQLLERHPDWKAINAQVHQKLIPKR